MNTANATQIGGTHYKVKFEHWDLAAELNLGYFEGQISKYVTRHRVKNGLMDAQKALHFTRKLHELTVTKGQQPMHRPAYIQRMAEYAEANSLTPLEFACVSSICNWQEPYNLLTLQERIERLIRETYGQEEAPQPMQGYVNQD